MVNIELYELKNMLMEAAAIGAAMVQKPNDVMRQKEAEAYMVAQGYAKSKLGELVAAVSALKKKTINFNKIN